MPEYPTADPRPDLVADRVQWQQLLSIAHGLFGEEDPDSVFWLLHGLRCEGASLWRGRDGWALAAGQIDASEYSAWKARYMMPARAQLVAVLARLGEVMR